MASLVNLFGQPMSGEYAVVCPASTDTVVPHLDSNWPTAAVLYTIMVCRLQMRMRYTLRSRVTLTHVQSEVKSTVQSEKQNSDTAMFGKFYVFLDTAQCCFSEATLGEFSATSGSPMTMLLRVLILLW